MPLREAPTLKLVYLSLDRRPSQASRLQCKMSGDGSFGVVSYTPSGAPILKLGR